MSPQDAPSRRVRHSLSSPKNTASPRRERNDVNHRVRITGKALLDVGPEDLDRYFAAIAQAGAMHLRNRGRRNRRPQVDEQGFRLNVPLSSGICR